MPTVLRDLQKFGLGDQIPSLNTGRARVLRETKGGKPGGACNETRRAGKVQSWGRGAKIATKGTSAPKVHLSGRRGREIEHLSFWATDQA